jgi:hypothetical protein
MNNTKSLSRIATAIVLVLAVAVSLWFASPLPVSEVAAQGGYEEPSFGGGGISGPGGTANVYKDTTSEGVFTDDVNFESVDGNVELTIDEGTIGLTETGRRLMRMSIDEMEDPPAPPKESNRIGLTYDLGPSGATFNPAITLEFTYDEGDIPEGVSEGNLVVAMWDEGAGKWVDLPCTVDPETNTITVSVSHFTAFSVIASTKPAAFTTSYLVILPATADTGETVNIRVKVANIGSLPGSYEVFLMINKGVAATQEVTLDGGTSQTVTFTTYGDTAGTYAVSVDGLSGTFTVKAPPAPPAPPAPAPAPAPVPAPVPPVAPPPAVFNWGLIGGIIAAVVVVVLLVYFLWWRRRVA